jgi:hypothetical protein
LKWLGEKTFKNLEISKGGFRAQCEEENEAAPAAAESTRPGDVSEGGIDVSGRAAGAADGIGPSGTGAGEDT